MGQVKCAGLAMTSCSVSIKQETNSRLTRKNATSRISTRRWERGIVSTMVRRSFTLTNGVARDLATMIGAMICCAGEQGKISMTSTSCIVAHQRYGRVWPCLYRQTDLAEQQLEECGNNSYQGAKYNQIIDAPYPLFSYPSIILAPQSFVFTTIWDKRCTMVILWMPFNIIIRISHR